MADIHPYPFLRHLRGAPTSYIRHTLNGRVLHEGVAQSFWFRPLSAVLSEVPVDDRELPLMFHARTADYQDVVVQATVTYRIAEPPRAAERIDFGVDPRSGQWRSTPLEQLGSLLTELAQQHALELLARLQLAEALVEAPARLRERIESGLTTDERLAAIGIAVVAVRVGPIRPETDLEKALGTPARELVQQEADRATFERRALAVESERAIAENELHNQIELAKREQELIAQRGPERAAPSRRRGRRLARRGRGASRSVRVIGDAEGEAEQARLAAYATSSRRSCSVLRSRNWRPTCPTIEQLTLAPDVLGEALAHVAGKR